MSSFLYIGPNLTYAPGISLPCGFARIDSVQPRNNRGSQTLSELPIGLQLLGKALDEARILQIAHAYEQSTEWHKARPKL
jgi:aspartyl-tRNA(Asn)/glutamyl-tRNA(Gln) amidotransferase subunit A